MRKCAKTAVSETIQVTYSKYKKKLILQTCPVLQVKKCTNPFVSNSFQNYKIISKFFLYITGLVDILSAENGERQLLKAFPPAHFEVYDVKEDGKLAFISRQKFHLFSDEPQHWKYQGIELLPGE